MLEAGTKKERLITKIGGVMFIGGCAAVGWSADLAVLGHPESAIDAVAGGGIAVLIGLGALLKGRFEYIYGPDGPDKEDLPGANIIPIVTTQANRLTQSDEYQQAA